VNNDDGTEQLAPLDLEDTKLLLSDGRDPSASDPKFHAQMVYAVCSSVYELFQRALGRPVPWGFSRPGDDGLTRLTLRPHCSDAGENACYQRESGEIRFGYYRARDDVKGRNLPGGYVFTCLSHDIVVHEFTHSLVDGLRRNFLATGGPEGLGFHEGFADLVSILQHFRYQKVVESQIRRFGAQLDHSKLLMQLAGQFGLTTGEGSALRSAIDDEDAEPRRFASDMEPHDMGSVLVTAIFDAARTIYRRKIARTLRLATGGSGIMAPGTPAADLVTALAEEAGSLSSQILMMCIRAIDYCPPVDLELGDFLRAVITSDRELVPADPWRYREALLDSFAKYGIYPSDAGFLDEAELVWRPPTRNMPPIAALTFARLQFDGDPARPMSAAELRRQAEALGEFVTRPEHLGQFGLAAADDPLLKGSTVDPPVVESIRASRRATPDGVVVFDLVAEVTQRRTMMDGVGPVELFGGSTIIIGPRGEIRYSISKNVLSERRLGRRQK